jgi:uncharacterized protein
MHIKIHKSYRNVVALCDSDLLGKTFDEGKLQLKVKENFYSGDKISKSEALETLQKQKIEDATFNIVGKESVQTALESGIITQNHIGKISNIPFALTLL